MQRAKQLQVLEYFFGIPYIHLLKKLTSDNKFKRSYLLRFGNEHLESVYRPNDRAYYYHK